MINKITIRYVLSLGLLIQVLGYSLPAAATKPSNSVPNQTQPPVAAQSPTTSSEATLASSFKCETFRDRQLTTLKEKLISNCNLNKPFSSSLSVYMGEYSYMYCCHSL